MVDSIDTPMFRRAHRAPQTRIQQPTYRKDLNGNWTQDENRLLVTENTAIKQKIQNVLFVLVGEEFFEPTFGSLVPLRLFEGVTDRIAFLLEGDTIGAVGTFMRDEVEVNHAQCSIEALSDDEGFKITLVYREKLREPVEWRFKLRKADLGYS